MLMKQLADMPTDRPKEQSIDMGHGKVKPSIFEIATLEGAHSVFKGIALKSGHMQSKRTSVVTSRCMAATRTSFRSMRTHRSI